MVNMKGKPSAKPAPQINKNKKIFVKKPIMGGTPAIEKKDTITNLT